MKARKPIKPIKPLNITPEGFSISVCAYVKPDAYKVLEEGQPINYGFHVYDHDPDAREQMGGIGLHIAKNDTLEKIMERINLLILLDAQRSEPIQTILPVFGEEEFGELVEKNIEHYGLQSGKNVGSIEALRDIMSNPGPDYDLYLLDCWGGPDDNYHGGWKEVVRIIDANRGRKNFTLPARILISAKCAHALHPEAHEMGVPTIHTMQLERTLADLAAQKKFKGL